MTPEPRRAAIRAGVTLHTGDLDFDEIVGYAREAESLGYEGFWVTEESGKDAFAVLALAAGATARITLGTGIANFYSRTPTLLAMGTATIARLSGGRTALGLGTGGIGFMERGHGIAIEHPVDRALEVAAIVRGLLTERRFSYRGRWFDVRDFHLREGPLDRPPPLYLAALGPGMVRAAARAYDGLITNWLTPESLAEMRGIVEDECRGTGRDPREVRILTLVMTCPDAADPAAVDAMRRGLAFYCASPHYHHIAEISGLGEPVRRVGEAWAGGDRDGASALVTDEMLRAFSVTGPPAESRERLAWMLDNDVYPIVYPLPRHDRVFEDHLAAVRLVAGLVTPQEVG